MSMAARRMPRTAVLAALRRPASVASAPVASTSFRQARSFHLTASTSSAALQAEHSPYAIKTHALTGGAGKIRGGSKLFKDADEAVKDVKSGSIVLSAGFGLCGTAETIIGALARRTDLQDLTAVSNNAGAGDGGLAPLVKSGQVNKMILSYLGSNKVLEKKYMEGSVSIELCPQGTLAERIRCGGSGIPAFYTPTGVGTAVQSGGIPVRMGPKLPNGQLTVLIPGTPRETRFFDGKMYNMEKALKGDVAIIRAWKVDTEGNCVFRYATKAFGPLMAKAASLTIVEAENIVEAGEIHPDQVDVPGIFIDRIVPATVEKQIELLKVREDPASAEKAAKDESPAALRRKRIAKRASKELKDGMYVNLGVGMPTLAPSYLDPTVNVRIQSENGLMGMGAYPTKEEADPDLINAGKETVTLIPGASTFDSSESFAMIRGGHIDVSLLGALQVDASGNLANFMIPGKVMKGMGGAMDLVSNPDLTKIVVLTDHTDKNGKSKIVQQCTLPLTGANVVSRIITELAVFDVDRLQGGLTLVEVAPGVTAEQVKEKTAASFTVSPDLSEME